MPIRRLMQLFGGVQRFQKKQDIPQVTEYLVKNETFRSTALGFHKRKSNMFTDLEKYLDQQILGKETPLELDEANKKGGSGRKP